MGYQAKLTPAAQWDLEEIRSYIARDNREAAEKVLREISERIGVLLDFPFSGATCREFAPSDVREIVSPITGLFTLSILSAKRYTFLASGTGLAGDRAYPE